VVHFIKLCDDITFCLFAVYIIFDDFSPRRGNTSILSRWKLACYFESLEHQYDAFMNLLLQFCTDCLICTKFLSRYDQKIFFPIYCSPAIFKLKIRIFGQVSVKAVVCFRIKNFTFRWFPLKYGNMTICNMVPSVILNFQILLFLSYDHHCGLVLHLRKKNFIQIVQLAADLWVSCKLLGNGN